MTERIRRGGWLTAFLLLAMLAAAGGAIAYVVLWQRMVALFPQWALYCLTSIALLRVFAITAIWLWSKSGVVAYVVLSIVAMVLLGFLGQKTGLLGIGGIFILAAVVWSKWRHMTWGLGWAPLDEASTPGPVEWSGK